MAELASRRDQLDITLANYRQAAATTATEDYKVAERATVLAMLIKEDPVTLELAKLWYALTSKQRPSPPSFSIGIDS